MSVRVARTAAPDRKIRAARRRARKPGKVTVRHVDPSELRSPTTAKRPAPATIDGRDDLAPTKAQLREIRKLKGRLGETAMAVPENQRLASVEIVNLRERVRWARAAGRDAV